MTMAHEKLVEAMSRARRGAARQRVPNVVEPNELMVLIPDEGGYYSQQIVAIEADRVHDGVLQSCRLRIALTVGDECRAVVALKASGDFDERVRVEVWGGQIVVGTTTLAWYGGAAYQARIAEFLRRLPWIELVESTGAGAG
jgi:hypothetical protein